MIVDSVNKSDTLIQKLVSSGISAQQTEFCEVLFAGSVQELVENVVVSLSRPLMDDSILFQ